MLKLNRKKFLVESLAFPNLNTSHVKVKLELIKKQKGVFFYLNTSHVKVKPIDKYTF